MAQTGHRHRGHRLCKCSISSASAAASAAFNSSLAAGNPKSDPSQDYAKVKQKSFGKYEKHYEKPLSSKRLFETLVEKALFMKRWTFHLKAPSSIALGTNHLVKSKRPFSCRQDTSSCLHCPKKEAAAKKTWLKTSDIIQMAC